MEEKKRSRKGMVITLLILIVLNLLIIYYNNINPAWKNSLIQGMAIGEINVIPNMDISSVVFIAQWVLTGIIVIILYAKHLKRKKTEGARLVISNIQLGKSGTELDSLYYLLQEKKHLNIGMISRSFKISKDKAMEWCKILEDSDLAVINYPSFSEPEIEIKEVQKI